MVAYKELMAVPERILALFVLEWSMASETLLNEECGLATHGSTGILWDAISISCRPLCTALALSTCRVSKWRE